MSAPRSDRLSASHLNDMLASLAPDDSSLRGVVKVRADYSFAQDVTYFIKESDSERFIVFNVTKDSKILGVSNELDSVPYIGEVLANFLRNNPNETGTLLIPLQQCKKFNFSSIRAAHIVLVQVDISQRKIILHDSKGDTSRYAFYTDIMENFARDNGFSYKRHGYKIQKGDERCGYFIHQYILLILSGGKNVDLSLFKPAFNTTNITSYLKIHNALPSGPQPSVGSEAGSEPIVSPRDKWDEDSDHESEEKPRPTGPVKF